MINKAVFVTSFAILAAALTGSISAHATSFYQRPFPEAVQDAPQVVRGRVGMTYVEWSKSADGTKRLYTYYELQVDEVFKGSIASKSIQMRELGGEKEGIGMQVAGTAKFSRGEDVVTFLGEKNPDGSYDVRGMMMGKFNINVDEKGQELLVGPGISSAGNSGIVHEEGQAQGDTQIQSTWTIEALRQLVRDQGASPKQPKASPVPLKIQPLKTTPTDSQSGVNRSPPGSASGLQTPIVEERSSTVSGFLIAFAVALIGTGLFLAWFFYRLKKRR